MHSQIVGLGYCGWDYLCVLPSIPIDDKVKIIQSMEQGGGPSATATFAAAKLGIPCAFAGVVGDDSPGNQIIQSFRSIGIDTSSIRIRPNVKSPTAYCWIEQQSGKRSIAWTSGECKPLSPSELNYDQIRDARILHLDGHQTEAAIAAAKFAKDNGVIVSIDAGTIVPNIEQLLELADIVIASEKFARNFCGTDDPVVASKKLFAMGEKRFTGVTLGARGSFGFDGANEYFQDSFTVDVVDTTGAGDTYHGAFAAAIVLNLPYQDAMRFASATAALKCTKLGGRTGLPDMETLNQFLELNP